MLPCPCLMAVFYGAMAAPEGSPTVLFDFESEADLRVWHYENRDATVAVKELSRAERFATSGTGSLRFFTPAWQPGMAEWPAFEGQPPITDWSGYDRLVFSATNVTPFDQQWMLFISDTKLPTRSGLLHRATLAPLSFTQVVVPLSQFAERGVNPADVHVMHFFTERPPGDMEVYLDHFVLLRPGEPLPEVPRSLLQELAPLFTQRREALRRKLEEARGRLEEIAAGAPEVAAGVRAALEELDGRVEALFDQLGRGDVALLQAAPTDAQMEAQLESLEAVARFRSDFARIRPAVQVGAEPRTDLAVGFATSMEKILPRAGRPAVKVAQRMELALARREKESFQVLVLPCERDLKQVQVRVTDLRTADGATFAAQQVDAVPVGYVETKAVPPYGSAHVGWWPDPILDFLTGCDIAKGDLQAFWVRFRAPHDQPAGLYQGKLEVWVEGAPVFAFDLAVQVYPFQVPAASPLPLAITFGPHDFPTAETQAQQEEWRRSEDYPIHAWKRHRLEWGDFLADYYITYDSLYNYGPDNRAIPDFEVLQRLHGQGRLGRFNLGYYSLLGEKPEDLEAWRRDNLERIRAAHDQAKALGLLDHAYIYGCDEHPEELFPGVQRAAEVLKREFPDVLVMTTTYDHSFGTKSILQAVDAFCPLTPRFDPALATQARAAGKQVWWYICCGPHHPYPNMFIEYPAIDGRLLMGALTAKYRPDGFLYYQVSIWNSRKPITSGPFTDWDPRSWTTYHGDGSWTCVGPDGTPLPTIRLENFRDGLEDYAYFCILEATVAKVEASPELREQRAEWLQAAKALLEVPADVAASLTEYTQDPAKVYRYRQALAQAIAEAGIPPQYPWPGLE
jgi:hypothetical protein